MATPQVGPDGEPGGLAGSVASGTRWVNLARACELLGVNESTVRRWADTGEIRCFRTPGGHRRFAEADLVAMTEQHAPAAGPLEAAAVARIRRHLAADEQADGWLAAIENADRDALRPLGRELVTLVADALAGRRPPAQIERAVDALGRRYGEILLARRTPLVEAVEACTFFRRSLDETVKQLAARRQMTADQATRGRERIAMLADRVLLGVTIAYSEA